MPTNSTNFNFIIYNSETDGDIIFADYVDNIAANFVSIDTIIAAIKTKTDFISVTQAVDLDTMESDISTNDGAISVLQDYGKVYNASSSGTLSTGYANSFINYSNSSAINVTVPPNSTQPFAIGAEIAFVASGTGTVTLVAGAGVTLQNKNGLVSNGQYSTFAIKKLATDIWIVSGDLTT